MCIATLPQSYQFVIGVLGLVGRNCRFQLQKENGNPQLPLLSGQKSRGRTLRLGKKVDVCTFLASHHLSRLSRASPRMQIKCTQPLSATRG